MMVTIKKHDEREIACALKDEMCGVKFKHKFAGYVWEKCIEKAEER